MLYYKLILTLLLLVTVIDSIFYRHKGEDMKALYEISYGILLAIVLAVTPN